MATEYKRIVIKKGSGVPTIPTSNDHTDGTWLATDLYVGEFYMDTATDKIYMRTASGIEEVIYDVASYEVLANKATDFTTLNNTKYPSTQAVENRIDSKISMANYWSAQGMEIRRGFVAQNNSTTLFLENTAVGTAVGTTTAVSVALGSFLSQAIRTRVQVSTPALNGICSYRSTSALFFVGQGFRFSFGFGVSDSSLNTGARQFYGLTTSTTALTISSTALVENLTNVIGIGSDALDTNLQIFHNDGTGTCTKIDLGANFLANRNATAYTDFITFELYNPRLSADIYYRVKSMDNDAIAEGVITGNYPSAALTMQACRTSGSSSNACSFDYSQMVISSIA
jgi:hypothetical protein